jgi:sec-independent protein translocase protein TatC
MNPSEVPDDFGPNMSLLEHLNELRKRLVWIAAAVLICTVIGFVFAESILDYLLVPYAGATGAAGATTLQTLRPTEGLETYFKVSLLFGAVLAMPVILVQFWMFISPGLRPEEKRYVYVFVPSSLALFVLGMAFAWFVLAPAAIFFLANFMPQVFTTDWTSQEYISFVLRLIFWLGVSFQLPIIVYFLSRVGLITSRTLVDQWRAAIVLIAVLAAVITPSIDPVTMILTMAPLMVLYILSILLARVGARQFERSMEV